ncbi:TonB-dependent receptor [Sphingomonas sp. DT-207]|uniref:TonB-dependent receptor n=1 Tax=Sphingomonas sp. DT-207 TaxID=3396167 RepID=UPI003F1A94E7
MRGAAMLSAGAMLWLPAGATAQTVGTEPAETVEQIVVTAERRPNDPQQVPIALTAISGERLARDNALNLDRIGPGVPNLTLTRNFGTSSGALVFLRGVGEGDSIFTNDPPVGVYVDDVLFARSTGSMFDLLDVERIEVLRGPQGTLYGRNTSGGAIRLVTRDPVLGRVEGAADATVGSYGRFDVRGTLNAPLGEDVALRVSALSRTQAGWGRNLTDGARVNDQDVQGGRAKLLWQAGAGLRLLATIDYSDEDSTPRFPQRFAPDPANPGRFLNRFVEPEDDIDNFRSADTDPLNVTRSGGASLRVDYDAGGVQLASISAYRALRSRIGFDQTANPPGEGANVILLQDQRQHSWSQEVQASGDALRGRLEFVAGLYLFGEHNDQLTAVSGAVPAGSPEARFRTDDFFVAPSRAASGTGNWSPYLPALDTRSVSAFGTLRFAATDALSLTAGLRWTHERKSYSVRFLSAPDVTYVLPDGTVAARTIEASWDDLSPRIGADYQLEGAGWSAMLYASLAKGFRSGSFDGRARNVDFVLNRQGPIAPERVWSSEAGVKSEWFGRRLRVNATYFVNDYTNIAFSAARANTTPPEIFRQNVGDARIQGLELEVTARPLAGFELGGTLGTLDDRLTRLAASPGCTAFVPDERDLDLRFTPDLRYSARASLEQGLFGGRVRIGGEWSGASPYFIALCNEPQHRVDNEEAVSAALGFESGDGAWGLTLSATNLTDRRYNGGSVGTIGYPVAPRQIDLTLRRRF